MRPYRGMTEQEIIKKLQDKTFVGPYGLMEQRLPGSHATYMKANEDRAVELYNHPGKWESGYCWDFNSPQSTYAIKPDYQPEQKEESVLGKKVLVYDRYRFAVPLKGWIMSVASDGAYQVSFYSDQHGYPNYMKADRQFFFSQQCQIVSDEDELKTKPEYVDKCNHSRTIKKDLGLVHWYRDDVKKGVTNSVILKCCLDCKKVWAYDYAE